jgi:hypothetical protein
VHPVFVFSVLVGVNAAALRNVHLRMREANSDIVDFRFSRR